MCRWTIYSFLFSALTFAWYKNQYLNFIRSDKKPYTFISNDGSLYFEYATEDDEGLYYCMIKMQGVGQRGGEGKVSMPIALTVSTASKICLYNKQKLLFIHVFSSYS